MRNFVIVVISFFLLSCGEEQVKQEIKVNGFAQGTTYHVSYVSMDGIDYQRAIDSLLIEVDNSMSTYQNKSIISKFNQADSIMEVDQLFLDVLNISKKVYQESDGAFDPTVAPIVNAWGFGFENINNTDSSTIDSLLTFVGLDKINIMDNLVMKEKKGVMLDFNAIAQGYTVDVLCKMLELRGINNYMVEVGGELKVRGNNINDTLWRIGIDKPLPDLKERELQAVVNLDNKALATSGNYRKFYEKNGMRYAHTINPKTCYPVQHSLLSATVLADNCALADAYATVFMVVGLEKSKAILESKKELDGLLIYSDENSELKTYVTPNLDNYIELNSGKK